VGQAQDGALMDFLGEVFDWFTVSENWSGNTGIPNRLWEHIQLCTIALIIAGVMALPPAIALGHVRRGGFLAVSAVNIGRAVPSFGIVALALPITIKLGLGLGFAPTLIALIALAVPPMFTNSYTGIRDVDPALVEAARGMGMTGSQSLRSIEIPAASPLILAAVRISAVQVVATATLGALVAWGGLGRFIIDGFAQGDEAEVFAGGLLVALLAVATELVFGFFERRLVPKGLRITRADSSDISTAAV